MAKSLRDMVKGKKLHFLDKGQEKTTSSLWIVVFLYVTAFACDPHIKMAKCIRYFTDNYDEALNRMINDKTPGG